MSDVLVLNFTYEALNVTSLRRAVTLLFSGKAEMVRPGDRRLRSPGGETRAPSIIRMRYHVRRPERRVALTRANVLLRDDETCQYCGAREPGAMTVDHVVPKSRRGPSTWENLVCACARCNARKNDRSPEEVGLRLTRRPRAPRSVAWARMRRGGLPEGWETFLAPRAAAAAA